MNKQFKIKRGNDEDDGASEYFGFPNKECKISKKTSQSHYYVVYFDEDIKEPSYYRSVIEVLNDASESDFIRLVLNTGGGRIDSAGAIIQAIKETEATVVAEVVGSCCSAGTLILLACNYVDIKPQAVLMFHQASYAIGGPSSTISSHVEFQKKWLDNLMEEAYEDFLTPEEIKDILKGREIWMDATETGKRLENFFNARGEKIQAKVAELEKERDKLELDENLKQVEIQEVVEKQQTKKSSRKKAKAVVQ